MSIKILTYLLTYLFIVIPVITKELLATHDRNWKIYGRPIP